MKHSLRKRNSIAVVNLFRLLDPTSKSVEPVKRPPRSDRSLGPQNNDSFHDLGKEIWAERTHKLIGEAERFVHYIKPDDLHRLNLDGMGHNLAQGNLVIVDLAHLLICLVNKTFVDEEFRILRNKLDFRCLL